MKWTDLHTGPLQSLLKLRTPSLVEKSHHGCLDLLGREQPFHFSCLIILECNFPKIWVTEFDQAIKKVLNFTLFRNIMGFEFGNKSFYMIRQLRDICDFGTGK